jgi:hypothetical protein
MRAMLTPSKTLDRADDCSVVCAATVVLAKFPAFLEHVKASGAGPNVTARLHFYHGESSVAQGTTCQSISKQPS